MEYSGFDFQNLGQIMDERASLVPIYGGISYERLEEEELHWPSFDKDHPGTPVLHVDQFIKLGKAELMGSVKDLKILEAPTKEQHGRGRFIFSDRYSVFDWGEMPDRIEHKGAAIALLGAFFFEKLEEMGIPTHYLGLVEDNRANKISHIKNPVNSMEVKMLQVIKPEEKGDWYDCLMKMEK